MASFSTVAEAEAAYAAAYSSYLKALASESYSRSSGAGSVSNQRPSSESLLEQCGEIRLQIDRMNRRGIRVRGVTPVG